MLVIDNAHDHPPGLENDLLEEFKFIMVMLLPPNTTPLLQAMSGYHPPLLKTILDGNIATLNLPIHAVSNDDLFFKEVLIILPSSISLCLTFYSSHVLYCNQSIFLFLNLQESPTFHKSWHMQLIIFNMIVIFSFWYLLLIYEFFTKSIIQSDSRNYSFILHCL